LSLLGFRVSVFTLPLAAEAPGLIKQENSFTILMNCQAVRNEQTYDPLMTENAAALSP